VAIRSTRRAEMPCSLVILGDLVPGHTVPGGLAVALVERGRLRRPCDRPEVSEKCDSVMQTLVTIIPLG